MIETHIPEISVEEIMERIRKEVKLRKLQSASHQSSDRNSASHQSSDRNDDRSSSQILEKPSSLPDNADQAFLPFNNDGPDLMLSSCPVLPQSPVESDVPPLQVKKAYTLNELSGYHDLDFITNAYKALLRRPADNNGKQHYLTNLRNGRLTKAEILGRLHYSREGRSRKISVKGLFLPFIVQTSFKIPLVGYIIRILTGILNLPVILKNIQVLENQLFIKNNLLNNQTKEIHSHIHTLRNHVADMQNEIASILNTKARKENIYKLYEHFTTISASLSKEITEIAEKITATKAALGNDIHEVSESLTTTKADLTKEITAVSEELATTNASLSKEITEIAEKITATKAALGNDIHEVSESLTTTKADLTNTQTDFAAKVESLSNDLHLKINSKADKTELKLYLQTVSYAKEYMKISQQNMQNLIDEAKKRLPDEILNEKELLLLTDEEKHKLDPFYVEFEDRFRGTREDIKKRVEVYLPYMEALPFKKEDIRALDLGCGRGEWLELLGEHGYNAQGIDINRIMVDRSKKLGLDVQQADVIEYLTSLEEESLSVVTGFHIIEHLPFQILMKMYDEVLRVLKPGGMVIFETPNPENLIVGACNFYTDPTHINPIVPETTQFILKYNGFINCKIKRFHLMKKVKYINDDNFSDINDLLYAISKEQDYCVIGYKDTRI